MRRFTIRLPIILPPDEGTRTVLLQPESDKPDVFIQGVGPADLLCGTCDFRLVKGIDEGQITNLVLRCPKCKSYNDIPFIPALQELVAEIIAAPDPIAKASALRSKLEGARNSGATKERTVEVIESDSDVLAKYIALLEPKSAGDLYSMLGCIVTFLTFLVTLKQLSSPTTVVNQYVTQKSQTSGRNSTCPCGSGKRFKHCHGRRK